MTAPASSGTRLASLRQSPVGQVAVAVTFAMVLYLAGPAVLGALDSVSNPSAFCGGFAESTGISGTVTEVGTGDPIPGAWVAVLDTNDFSIAAGPVADETGAFEAEVAPGSYFLYLVDPAGHHPDGFNGAPDTVTVVEGEIEQVEAEMTATRGSVSGTITESGSGDPVADAVVISLGGPDTVVEVARVADGSGEYRLPGLAPGNHFVGFIDPAGDHEPRFWPDSANVPESDPVPVSAGASTVADAVLPVTAGTPGGAEITGTMTDAVNGEPIPYGIVFALNAANFQIARAAFTDASGDYTLDVAAGDYKLAFVDARGWHLMEWYDDLPSTGLPDAVSVTAPGVADAALAPSTGTIVGTVTDSFSAFGIGCVWVIAIGPNGMAGGALTDANGAYRIEGLTPGTYRVTYADPPGGRTQEFWDDSPDFGEATTLNVTPGGTAVADAALSFVAPDNDNFDDAHELTGASGTISATTNGASDETGEPSHGGGAFDRSIWYRWTAPATGQAWFDGCDSFNQVALAAYTGSAVDDLDPIASASPSTCGGADSEISFPVTSGTEYSIAVDGPAGAGGVFGDVLLRWSIGEAAPTLFGELAFDGNPYDLVVAPNGDAYVTDLANQRVVRLDPTGLVVDEFGGPGNGPGEFFDPVGIAASSSGDIYVADSSNNRVQKFSPAGDFLLEFGSMGSGNGEFFDLGDVVVDDDGDVFVSDVGNSRIQRFDADGQFVSAFGTAGTGPGELFGPGALALTDTGYLYVADDQGASVEKYTTSGTFVEEVISTGSGQGFLVVLGLAVDEAGALYTIDSSHDRAQKFSSTGTLLSRWGRSGDGSGEFFFPSGIALNANGDVFVTDSGNERIQAFG